MRSRLPLFAVGLAGTLVLVAGVATAIRGFGPTPADVAGDYLKALQAGQVSKALKLTAHSPSVDVTLLTQDLPAASRVTLTKLGKVTESDDNATAAVTYDVDGGHQSATLRLSKHGDDWLIDNGLSTLVIDGAAPDVTAVTVNGLKVKVSSGGAELPALPGLYNAAMPVTFAFTARAQKSPVTTDPGALHFDLLATGAAKKEAAAAVLRSLKTCLAKRPQVLENPCHAKTATFVDKADFKNSDYRWSLAKDPKLSAFVTGTTYEVSTAADGKANINVFAVDLKHRYPPQRVNLDTPISFRGLVDVTFTGRTAHVSY